MKKLSQIAGAAVLAAASTAGLCAPPLNVPQSTPSMKQFWDDVIGSEGHSASSSYVVVNRWTKEAAVVVESGAKWKIEIPMNFNDIKQPFRDKLMNDGNPKDLIGYARFPAGGLMGEYGLPGLSMVSVPDSIADTSCLYKVLGKYVGGGPLPDVEIDDEHTYKQCFNLGAKSLPQVQEKLKAVRTNQLSDPRKRQNPSLVVAEDFIL